MNDPVNRALSAQMDALVNAISGSNAPGNLEGLFCRHVLMDDLRFPLVWQVDWASETWLDNIAPQTFHAHVLSALGYSIHAGATEVTVRARDAFVKGLEYLRLRDPFPADRVSFTYQPISMLGISLGVMALGTVGEEFRRWLRRLLAERPNHGAIETFHQLLNAYAGVVLGEMPMGMVNLDQFAKTDELSLISWGLRRNAFRLTAGLDPLALQRSVLELFLSRGLDRSDGPRCSLVWSAVHLALTQSVENIVLSRDHVVAMLQRFEDAMRRWRWDDPNEVKNPIRWPVLHEREVQDLVWLVLRSVFDDIVDEEALPRVGHSTYKADFGIPSLRLLVEVKYVYRAADFKKIEKEVMEDSVAYLMNTSRYDRIMVFIYDASASVQEHGTTRNALRSIAQVEDVVIVSRPSQLASQSMDA